MERLTSRIPPAPSKAIEKSECLHKKMQPQGRRMKRNTDEVFYPSSHTSLKMRLKQQGHTANHVSIVCKGFSSLLRQTVLVNKDTQHLQVRCLTISF
eukprot:3930136-Amphidinium_carterae.2